MPSASEWTTQNTFELKPPQKAIIAVQEQANENAEISTIQMNDARSDWLNCAGGHTIGDLYFIFGSTGNAAKATTSNRNLCSLNAHRIHDIEYDVASIAYSCNHIFYFCSALF